MNEQTAVVEIRHKRRQTRDFYVTVFETRGRTVALTDGQTMATSNDVVTAIRKRVNKGRTVLAAEEIRRIRILNFSTTISIVENRNRIAKKSNDRVNVVAEGGRRSRRKRKQMVRRVHAQVLVESRPRHQIHNLIMAFSV